MIFDWLIREGWAFASWWLLITLAGAAALPWCLRLLGGLPDKGYTLARPLGMLLVGFVFWLLASLGFLQNTTGSIVTAWLIVLVGGVLYAVNRKPGPALNLRQFWRDNKKTIIIAEVLFFVLFLSWTVFRAYQNDTATTEKPMDLMFISSIMRSDSFPPNDGWLAGYSISYYYFGYLMSAMLSMLSGVNSGSGYGLTVSLWFALSGLTAFGIGNNLVRSRSLRDGAAGLSTGLLATTFVIFMGNFQLPLIELPYQSQTAPAAYLDFWGTQDRSRDALDGYQQLPEGTLFDAPQTWDYWWWFRASRVLTDYNLDGTLPGIQPIDEFPQFSFLLGDNHPHVLALPFVMMTLGLALNLLLQVHKPRPHETLLYGLTVGGLIFLNTWDGPIYLVVLVGVDALRRLLNNHGRLFARDWLGLIGFGLTLLLIAIVAYLPFFIGFRSQAAGLLPNFIYPTLFRRYFIMFGPLLLLAGSFIALEVWRGMRAKRMNWPLGISVALFTLLGFVGLMLLLGALSAFLPSIRDVVQGTVNANGGWANFLPQLLEKRLEYGVTTLVLLVTIVLVVARLFPRDARPAPTTLQSTQALEATPYAATTGFVLLLVGVAASLTLLPEFIVLRDNFGTRINTVFKFYYQAWVALSIVGAYAVYAITQDGLLPRPARALRVAFGVLLASVMFLGLLYPIYGIHNRMFVETGRLNAGESAPPLTLDGRPRMTLSADDYEAVQCLARLVPGDDAVVAEAEEMSYRAYYARVGAITGIPIVLGWENHQGQWRGPTFPQTVGSRGVDLETLYSSSAWDRALTIIERYEIDYIMYGETERRQYGSAGEEKFTENLELVCDYGDSHVYRVSEDVLARWSDLRGR